MTTFHKMFKVLSLTMVMAVLSLGLFSSIPASAVYGGSTGTSGTVTTSVSGSTLTINLANIASGDTVTLTNLIIPGLTGLSLTFNANVASGSVVLTPLSSTTLNTNLPNSFIVGYSMSVTGFSSTVLTSIVLNVQVADSTLSSYDLTTIKSYTSSSPWVAAGLSSSGSTGGFRSYAITSAGPFSQVALSGVLNSSLTRSGADSITPFAVAGALLLIMSFFLAQSLNTKKATKRN